MPATLTYLSGRRRGKSVPFDQKEISIGRSPENLFRLGDEERRVSSHHARIVRRGERYILTDPGSTNGTLVNGRRVISTELMDGDLIELGAGGPLLRFTLPDPNEEQAADRPRPTAATLGPDSIERLVDRRVRGADSRLVLLVALSMLIGAAGGVLLASRDVTSFSSVGRRYGPAVVLIRIEFDVLDENGEVVAVDGRVGSGFVISPGNFIVTNRHLFEGPDLGPIRRTSRIEVLLAGTRHDQSFAAELCRVGGGSADVAILCFDPPANLRGVSIAREDIPPVEQGDEVVVLGYPLGFDLLTLTRDERVHASLVTGVVGRVSNDLIQLNLKAYQGNSGGPVFNRRGEIIGILTAHVGSAPEIALCTPIRLATDLIDMIKIRDIEATDSRQRADFVRPRLKQ